MELLDISPQELLNVPTIHDIVATVSSLLGMPTEEFLG